MTPSSSALCASIGPGHAVADREHVRQVGAHLVVDENLAALADVETERFGVDAGRDGTSPDGDEHVVAFDAFGLSVLLDVDEHAGLGAPAVRHARAGANLEALFAEDAVGFLHDVVVHARKNRGQQLDDGDFGAESFPDGAELEADDAAADDDEVFRDSRGS